MIVVDRRRSNFTERLSIFMVMVAAGGAFLVLFDPKFTFDFDGQILTIGGEGFSADLKGAVISAILIGGWTAVKEYWLGASAGGQSQQESVQRIAEKSSTVTAEAIAANTSSSGTLKTDTVNVASDTTNVTTSSGDTTSSKGETNVKPKD